MTFVTCSNVDCIHCDRADFHCTKDRIFVGGLFDGGCEDFNPYYNTAEYDNKYYKCVTAKDGKIGRCACYGKRIEYNGRLFYTSDRITENGEYYLTDAKTGYAVGTYKQLEQRFEKICELAEKMPNVVLLPLAEWDNCGYVIVEESKDER